MFLGVVHMFWKQINILLMWYFLSLFVFYWCFFLSIFFIILIFNPMTQLECDRVGSLQVICSFFLSTCICSFFKIQINTNQSNLIDLNPNFSQTRTNPTQKRLMPKSETRTWYIITETKLICREKRNKRRNYIKNPNFLSTTPNTRYHNTKLSKQ